MFLGSVAVQEVSQIGKPEEEESEKSEEGWREVGDSEAMGQHPSIVIIRKGGRRGRPGGS